MGRILKVVNTKKLASHNNMLQIMIIGCISQERRKGQAKEKEHLELSISQKHSTAYSATGVMHFWSPQEVKLLGVLWQVYSL